MHRVNHILGHLQVGQVSKQNVTKVSKLTCGATDEVTSLDVFTFMNAILNGGKGGGINEIELRDETKLRRVFDKMDLNASGDLDLSEFAKAARLCSMVITDDEIDRIFKTMAGSSGTIKFNEFSSAISSLVSQVELSNTQFEKLPNDKKTVIALWDQYMNGNKRASDLFTRKLLNNQSLKTLTNVDLDRQVHMVYGMISNAFRALVDEEKLLQRLEKEGQRHYYTFRLTDKHYSAVKEALLETLPVVIGRDYNFYAQMQFEKYWDVIEGAMIKGFNQR